MAVGSQRVVVSGSAIDLKRLVDRDDGPRVPWSVHRGDAAHSARLAPTYYAAAPSHYRVAVHVLAPWQHAFLAACAGTGAPIEAAAAATATSGDAAAEDAGLDLDGVWASLFTWLAAAGDAGMVTVVPADVPASVGADLKA